MNTTHRWNKSLLACLCAVSLGLSACATSGLGSTPSIKTAMKGLKTEHQAAMNSATMDEFKNHVALFKQNVQYSVANIYQGSPEEQALYQQGMQELNAGLNRLDQAIATNKLATSKQTLDGLLTIRNKYHKVLKK